MCVKFIPEKDKRFEMTDFSFKGSCRFSFYEFLAYVFGGSLCLLNFYSDTIVKLSYNVFFTMSD